MMRLRSLWICSASLLATSSPLAQQLSPENAQQLARDIYESNLSALDPHLLKQAEQLGLYDREALPVLRSINPFFLRGDFNGDGGMDIAFWVQNRETQESGVAIVHSTLEALHVFGAGHPRPAPQADSGGDIRVDAWRLIPAGQTESHPYGHIPEIGLRAGEPFTFERETLEFNYLGKSAFVFYWSGGRYWEFGTAD